MKNRKHRYYGNSFEGRITWMVLSGILLIAVTVSAVVLRMSQSVFMETYGTSQGKVFNQIETELNDFHKNVMNVVNAIDSSWAFRLYLSGDSGLDNVQTFQNIYQMEEDLNQSKSSGMERLNILVLGMNGRHYLSRTETISMPEDEILKSKAAQAAITEPGSMHYTFSKGAYTTTTRDKDVLIASKALYFQNSGEVYGVVLITLTMDELRQYYDYFVTDNASFFMVSDEGVVVCSSEDGETGREVDQSWYEQAVKTDKPQFTAKDRGRYLTVMQRYLPYQKFHIYGVIDNRLALNQLYNMPLLAVICAAIGGIILLVCLWFVRQTISPLSAMVQRMSRIRGGNFKEYMPIEGTVEVRELAETYNYMLDNIQQYIDELLKTQKKQRKSEIQALQMQINPHYIYNTLASIKWLVYQNDTEKTISTIDAFISLLRNTINNTDEFITISQELENLEHYILINHTRYGDSVKVEYYVSRTCRDCLLPKLVLQPFIENAFFHAFPSGRTGTIQIIIGQKNGTLEIRIIDDGVGMEQSKARRMLVGEMKKEHFSGIGIHNVQERLKLLYGEGYGIHMESRECEGTTVTITLPVREEEGHDTK